MVPGQREHRGVDVVGVLEEDHLGRVRLDRAAAEGALAPLAEAIGVGLPALALGIVRVANATMTRALRRVTVERGIDGRQCHLLAFGGAVMALHDVPGGVVMMIVGILLIIFTMYAWWREVVREATFEGFHNPIVQLGMRYGMVLFIASEVMFFVAWFWAYFNAALYPPAQIGGVSLTPKLT